MKILFKNKGKIKTFSDRIKITEVVISTPAPQQIMKEVPKDEGR